MIRHVTTILALLALSACAGPAADPEALIGEVRATQAARFQAMIDADVTALERMLAADLVYTHTTGTVDTKQALLESLSAAAISYEAIDLVDNQIRIAGVTATSTGTAAMRVSTTTQRFEFSVRFTEVYRKEQGVWQLIVWQSTRVPERE